MTKDKEWLERLVAYANSVNGKAFKWGHTDCAYLVRGSLHAAYQKDVLRGMGSYRTSASALAVARQVGHIGRYLRDKGFVDVKPDFAHSGDVVVFRGRSRGHPQLGVMVTGRLMVSDPAMGVVVGRVPWGQWPKGTKLWRAPHDA